MEFNRIPWFLWFKQQTIYFDIFTGKHGNNKRKRELHIANESKFKIPATKFPVQMLSKKLGSCLVVSTGMRYMM